MLSEQDALCVGNDGARPSRLTRAVFAASTHTSEAHFLLVADGFELDATIREAAVRLDLRRRDFVGMGQNYS